jgi:hypothetical protein
VQVLPIEQNNSVGGRPPVPAGFDNRRLRTLLLGYAKYGGENEKGKNSHIRSICDAAGGRIALKARAAERQRLYYDDGGSFSDSP